MARQIIIGKNGNQPFAIPDPKVSRHHAVLYIDEQAKRMTLMDTESTNGTYIYNGKQFVRLAANQHYPVTPDTMIQLGPDTRFHIKKLIPEGTTPPQPQPRPQPQPEKIDIRPLRLISDHYTQTKMKLESKTGTINGLRSCTILVSILAGGLGGFATKSLDLGDDAVLWQPVIGLGVAAFFMAVLLLIINCFNKKLIKRRNENEREYAIKYCCPKCKLSFRGKIYENILAEGKCPRCKSIYYDSSEHKN